MVPVREIEVENKRDNQEHHKQKKSVRSHPEESKEILIPILTGWGNYFAHSTVSEELHQIWNYAQNRLMYMYCRQHNIPRRWRYEDIEKNGLSLTNYFPAMLCTKRHNAM